MPRNVIRVASLAVRNAMDSKDDPIPADLERALFKRFWLWLGIVGSVVIALATGLSVLVAVSINSIVSSRAHEEFTAFVSQTQADKTLLDASVAKMHETVGESNQLATQAKDNVASVSTAVASANAAVALMQGTVGKSNQLADNAAVSARQAQEELDKIKDSVATVNNLQNALGDVEKLQNSIATDPHFASLVQSKLSLQGRIGVRVVHSDFVDQHVEIGCADNEILVSAACIGFNSSPQAAVGPQYSLGLDGVTPVRASCDRYGNDRMNVQATAICLSVK